MNERADSLSLQRCEYGDGDDRVARLHACVRGGDGDAHDRHAVQIFGPWC